MKILVLANDSGGLFHFRKELLEELIKWHEVYVSVPDCGFISDLKAIGCKVDMNQMLDRRGTNPLKDLRLLRYYKHLIKRLKPDITLTYTIKPNIYGGMACGKNHIPYVVNITGLGTSIEDGGILQRLTLFLYKIGLKDAQKVFFQNKANRDFMLDHQIISGPYEVLPGSGVNTTQHCYEPYPKSQEIVIFTTLGRIMKDKGINEILEAAKLIKTKYPNTIFRLIGEFDEAYENKVKEYEQLGIVTYIPQQKEVHSFIRSSHAIIHASYHEGMSNVLLEAASTGRPVIATTVHGCIEAFDPDVTGIAFQAGNVCSLVNALERFLALSYEQREAMGKAGRIKMEKEFCRSIVINKYMEEIIR